MRQAIVVKSTCLVKWCLTLINNGRKNNVTNFEIAFTKTHKPYCITLQRFRPCYISVSELSKITWHFSSLVNVKYVSHIELSIILRIHYCLVRAEIQSQNPFIIDSATVLLIPAYHCLKTLNIFNVYKFVSMIYKITITIVRVY